MKQDPCTPPASQVDCTAVDRTPLQTLAGLTLDVPDVVAWAAGRRAEGATLADVADEVADAVGSPVSRETIRLWLKTDEAAS